MVEERENTAGFLLQRWEETGSWGGSQGQQDMCEATFSLRIALEGEVPWLEGVLQQRGDCDWRVGTGQTELLSYAKVTVRY